MTGDACKDAGDGKFNANWEGPFRVLESLNNGAFRLEHLNEYPIPRIWNADNLKFHFS